MVAYGNCLIIIPQDVIYVYDLSNWYPEFSGAHCLNNVHKRGDATHRQTNLIET